jgi:acyl-CoA synthetase (AMP-forming)/AMP-acid ligase II
VVLSEGSSELSVDLNALCRRRLPKHGRPVRIVVLAQFPLLSTGKIDRQALRRVAETAA